MVAHQFLSDHLLGLPVAVGLGHGEGLPGEVARSHDGLHPVEGRQVLGPAMEDGVLEGEGGEEDGGHGLAAALGALELEILLVGQSGRAGGWSMSN